MPVYRLHATASSDAAAALDFRGSGVINAIYAVVQGDFDADTEGYVVEVSFGSSNSMSANDTTASIFIMRAQLSVGAAGQTMNGDRAAIGGVEIPFEPGERIYMHTSWTGPGTAIADVYLYCSESGSAARPSRRLR